MDSGSLESENGLSVGGQLSLLRGGGNLTLVSTATTTLNGGLTVSGATLTGGDGTVDVNGDVLILTGSLLSTTGVMSITGDFTKSGGTFNHNDGRITFDGSAGQLITPSDATFNGIIIYKDAGTVSLAGPLICTSLNVASGTLSPGSYPVTTNQMYVSGGTFTGASGRLDINKSLAISDGTLTAPSGVMTLSGSLTESIDGIFNHNNGRVILDSASPANLAVAEPFNDLTVNDGLAAYWKFDETSGGTAPDVSGNGYNLGIGGAPVISTDVADTNFPNARSWGFGSNYSYANGVTGIADTFTVSGFFRADATGGGTLINYRTPSTNNGWMITTSGFGTTGGRLVFNYGGVGTYEIDPLTHPMSQGVYNYFAMTVANGTATAYWTTTSGGAVYSNSVAIGSPSGSLSELIVGAGFGGNFTGLLDDLRVYNRVLSLPEITLLSQGNLRASDNAVTLGSALDVNGDLTLMTGGLDASVSDFDINVAGDWNNSGIFSAQQCTVTLDGTNQSIVGDTTFYNLTKSVTAADTLTFGSGSYTTIANTVTFNGAADNLLSLRSSVDGNQWYFDPQGTRALAYLDVKDSNNFGTTPIMAAGLNITDSGNLTNWIFDETPPGIASISPVNGSSNVSLTPTLVLTLNEESDSVADKHITIKKASDHSTVETISVTSGLVTVSGAVVTIRPSVALSANTTYYVLVDSGAFTDSADNEFAGIAATSAWSFTTVASEEEEELPASGADSAGGGAYRGVAGAGGRSDKAQVVRETFLRRFERQVASDETTIPPISGSGSSSRSSRPAFVKAPATSTGVVVAEKRGHLEVTRQNVAVVYKDVPVDAWFAPYVSFLIEEDIAQGYKDDAGKAKGEFGVENAVTYAELAKMVLQASHKDLKTAAAPRNATARGTWASPFIALSEDLHFSVYVPTLDIMKPATRGEVIQTILEAFDIPVSAKNFATFSDLPATHPYGPAIGVAYLYGLIDGDTNPDGTQKGTVRPDDEVNRAEVAKIIALALKLLK